jgi:P4 family phage/plasmid primase-like protien
MNGFSPTAPEPGRKAVIDADWTRWCHSPMTAKEVAARKSKGRNIGVATGYQRLVVVEIDVADDDPRAPEIHAAVRSVVVASTVAKRGSKGRSDFYRMPVGAALVSRQFRDKDGHVIAEVLADGRQTVIPPSIHPDGHPYTWLTDGTLYDTTVDELPECPGDIVERLEEVLQPWMKKKRASERPQRTGPPPVLSDAMKKRHRAWALKALDARVKDLEAKTKPGRNRLLFELVCAVGRFVHHGVITDEELRAPALAACNKDGLIGDNGLWDCEKTIDRGLRYSLADELGDLTDRDPPKSRGARAKGHVGNGATPPPPLPPDPPTGGNPPSGEPPKAAAPGTPAANEDAIAEAFAHRHADELRYCHDWGAWLKWDGSRWGKERRKLAFHYARHMARYANADEKPMPAKASTAAGVERFAQADPRLSTLDDDWDRDPWLLATPGGTVDLGTGKLRPAAREDFITKRTAVTPAAPGTPTPPMWTAFLKQATLNNAELISYLQRMAGYSLTGDVSEHAVFFLYGDGGNGKGTFLNTLQAILADHVAVAAMDTFAVGRGSSHPTELALLRGARLVTAQETEEGRAWNQVRLKSLTGGDPVPARFMRQDFFTFQPTFKLIFSGNHRPTLRSVDDAVRRRFNMIPFTHKPEKPDRRLAEKLKAEWPGILRWAIDGCLAWQKDGLNPPEIVCNATEAYFDEQDLFGQWIAECCDVGPLKSDTRAALYGSWKAWCERNGDHPGGVKTFSQALVRAGYDKVKNTPGHHGKRGFKGITVKPVDTSSWQERHE